MSREEIDAAISRHADFELLYDKPYEDKKKVRVAGPFTVESLSPHRSLAFAGSAVDDGGARERGRRSTTTSGSRRRRRSSRRSSRTCDGRDPERRARTSGSSSTPRALRRRRTSRRSASARRRRTGRPKRVGITIGPQYGTVGPAFIKDAAREAIKATRHRPALRARLRLRPAGGRRHDDDYVTADDGLPSVAAERRLGTVPVLLVRMNADLVMGEELKKTGAGNLFTVFGEPDIEIEHRGRRAARRSCSGVDVYDPNTGEVRSNDTDQIALWMIDTNYNGESFFVRHCYFTGGQDPYKRLKTALKAEIDEDAWATLYRTESRPFPSPRPAGSPSR